MGEVYHLVGALLESQRSVVNWSIARLASEPGAVAKAFEEARGRVLFIDEAHRLADVPDPRRLIGDLVETMTRPEYKQSLVVILAGYQHEMDRLLEIDEGFRSRFQETVRFPHLLPSTCLELLIRRMREICPVSADVNLIDAERDSNVIQAEYFFAQLCTYPGWANARDIGTLASQIARTVQVQPLEVDTCLIVWTDIHRQLAQLCHSRGAMIQPPLGKELSIPPTSSSQIPESSIRLQGHSRTNSQQAQSAASSTLVPPRPVTPLHSDFVVSEAFTTYAPSSSHSKASLHTDEDDDTVARKHVSEADEALSTYKNDADNTELTDRSSRGLPSSQDGKEGEEVTEQGSCVIALEGRSQLGSCVTNMNAQQRTKDWFVRDPHQSVQSFGSTDGHPDPNSHSQGKSHRSSSSGACVLDEPGHRLRRRLTVRNEHTSPRARSDQTSSITSVGGVDEDDSVFRPLWSHSPEQQEPSQNYTLDITEGLPASQPAGPTTPSTVTTPSSRSQDYVGTSSRQPPISRSSSFGPHLIVSLSTRSPGPPASQDTNLDETSNSSRPAGGNSSTEPSVKDHAAIVASQAGQGVVDIISIGQRAQQVVRNDRQPCWTLTAAKCERQRSQRCLDPSHPGVIEGSISQMKDKLAQSQAKPKIVSSLTVLRTAQTRGRGRTLICAFVDLEGAESTVMWAFLTHWKIWLGKHKKLLVSALATWNGASSSSSRPTCTSATPRNYAPTLETDQNNA